MNKYVISREKLYDNEVLLKRYINTFNINIGLEDYVVMLVDLKSFINEELGYSFNDDPLKIIFKNPAHPFKAINVIEEENLHYCFTRDSERADKFIEQIGKLSSKTHELREQAEFFIKCHPKKFDAKARLIKYKDMNLEDLIQTLKLFHISNINELSTDNIRINDFKVNRGAVENYIIEDLYKNGVKNDYLKITHFYNMLCFKDRKVEFNTLPAAHNKASDLFPRFFKTPWHKLGDREFLNHIYNELKYYTKYPERYARDFVDLNLNELLEFDIDLKNEIFEMLENTTPSALLFNNKTYMDRLEHYHFIRDNILNNERIFNKSLEFKKLNDSYYFFQHQRYHFGEVCNVLLENNIKSIDDLLNMKAEQFFYIFDPNKEKKIHALFVEEEDTNATIEDVINSFDTEDMQVLRKSKDYRIVLNQSGGLFLILFDCIKILRGESDCFKIYQRLFAKDKIVDNEYQQKILSYLYLFSHFLFDGELKKDYETLVNKFFEDEYFTIINIDYDNRLSEELNNKRISNFVILKNRLEKFTDYIFEITEILKGKPKMP